MPYLRGSTNYVWCTTSVLGKGATGAVFQGVNKVNGEPVAVKTFNQVSHMRPVDVQMREFEVLKKVNHINIVKLLAIEEEQHEGSRGKVIVMELCTGGSLYNILDDPENTYGLEEGEFLLVLDHLSSGMKHLRDNNLVHRDLKPGNIMKYISDDGSTIYKLTDFGAARELQEGQQFNSLYGTEEYLHPDMYERAVLKKQSGKPFGATVDLWSIGVTLYHVATGNLPFRPYGGRKNRETMYRITTEKESGVISGIQTEDRGQIDWSRSLPANCQLSVGLKDLVTPLLAGLLETDKNRIWNFDRFFNQVTNILSRRIVSIFHVNRCSCIKVYIHPDENFEHLCNYITKQTEVKMENQILLFKENLFVDVVGGEGSRAGGYRNLEEPLTLFCKDNNNVAPSKFADIPKFPEFSNLVSVDTDAGQARTACSIGHMCKRRIEQINGATIYMMQAVDNFTNHIKRELAKLENKCAHLKEITSNHKTTISAFLLSQSLLNAQQHGHKEQKITELNEELNRVSAVFLKSTEFRVCRIHAKNVAENRLQLEWEASCKTVSCPADAKVTAKAKTYVERLRDSWQHLVRDRATRSLSYNDEQFHVLERIKITAINGQIKSLWENDCVPPYTQLAEYLGDWYKISQTVYLQTMILNNDVQMYANKLENFTETLNIFSIQYKRDIEDVLSESSNLDRETAEVKDTKIRDCWKKLRECTVEIVKIQEQNKALAQDFQSSLKLISEQSRSS